MGDNNSGIGICKRLDPNMIDPGKFRSIAAKILTGKTKGLPKPSPAGGTGDDYITLYGNKASLSENSNGFTLIKRGGDVFSASQRNGQLFCRDGNTSVTWSPRANTPVWTQKVEKK